MNSVCSTQAPAASGLARRSVSRSVSVSVSMAVVSTRLPSEHTTHAAWISSSMALHTSTSVGLATVSEVAQVPRKVNADRSGSSSRS